MYVTEDRAGYLILFETSHNPITGMGIEENFFFPDMVLNTCIKSDMILRKSDHSSGLNRNIMHTVQDHFSSQFKMNWHLQYKIL